jgi:hypothetical protein
MDRQRPGWELIAESLLAHVHVSLHCLDLAIWVKILLLEGFDLGLKELGRSQFNYPQ